MGCGGGTGWVPLSIFRMGKESVGLQEKAKGVVWSVAVPVKLGGPLRYRTTLGFSRGWACRQRFSCMSGFGVGFALLEGGRRHRLV